MSVRFPREFEVLVSCKATAGNLEHAEPGCLGQDCSMLIDINRVAHRFIWSVSFIWFVWFL